MLYCYTGTFPIFNHALCKKLITPGRPEVRPLFVGNTSRWAPLSGRTREDQLQAGRHGVPQPAQSDTSVPRRPPHSASDVASRLRLCSTSTDNNFSCLAVDSTRTTVGLSALLVRVRRSGTRYPTNSEIRRVVQTVFNSSLTQFCLVSTNMTSALEVSLNNDMHYIAIWIHVLLTVSYLIPSVYFGVCMCVLRTCVSWVGTLSLQV